MTSKHLIAALCLMPLTAVAQSEEEDKGYLTTLIEDNLSGDARTVNITGFEGALSSEATIASLTVADSDGVWLTLEDVTLIWNRSALLRGAIDVEELSAGLIVVARPPLPANDLPAAEATPFALPELPVSIALDTLQIDRIELGPDFLGEEIALGVAGAASLAGGEGTANIVATRLGDKQGRFAIDGAYVNATGVLDILLDLNEGPDGIATRLLDLPGAPAVALTLEGDAPLDDFAATLALATDGQDRLAGDFTLTRTEAASRFSVDIAGDIAPLLAPDYQDFFGQNVTLAAVGQQTPDGFDLETLDLATRKLRLQGTARIDGDGWPERLSLSGGIADDDGEIVLLPIAGPKTFADRVSLNIGYDRSISDDWTAEFDIIGLDRPGLYIQTLGLDGGGEIVAGGGASVGRVTANMTYAAEGLELDDAGASEAFGDTISGQFELSAQEGEPTRIPRLTLTGPGIELLADATIAGAGNGFETSASAVFSAEALGRFATLAGQPDLAGGAAVTVIAKARPLDGLFDVLLTGETRDLAIGIGEVDPLLRGTGDLSLQAVRDTEGTRLEGLRIETDEALIRASANLTSIDSTAEFDARIDEVGLILDGLSGPVELRGTAARDASGTTTYDISGQGPAAELNAQGRVIEGANGVAVVTDTKATVRDLSRFNQIAGRALAGYADLTLNGVYQTDTGYFDAEIDAQTRDLQIDIAQVDPLLAGDGTLVVSGKYDSAGYLLERLALATPQARIDANGSFDDGAVSAVFDAALSDVGLVLDTLSGPVSAKGTAARSADGVTRYDIDATGPAAVLSAEGQVTEDDTGFTVLTDAMARVTDLSRYADLAARDISGAIDLDIAGQVQTDTLLFDATITGTSRDLRTGVTQIDPLLTGPGTWDIAAARTDDTAGRVDRLNISTPNLTLTGEGVGSLAGALDATFDLMLPDASLILPGLPGALQINATGQRDDAGTAQVQLDARGQGTSVDMDATIAPPAEDYRTTGTLSANIESLSPFAALAGQNISGGLAADISGSGLPDLSELAANVEVRSNNLGIGNPQIDQLLRGLGQLRAEISRDGETIRVPAFSVQTAEVSASGSLLTDGTTGQADFDARLANIGLFTDQLSGPVTADGTASLNANQSWGLNVSATGPGGIGANASGTIVPGGNLNLNVDGNLPLGLANTILEPRRLSGEAQFDLAINGPPALSSVSGRISTAGARLAAPSLGQALNDITGGVTLAGSSAQIDLSAGVQSGGSLSINGPVALTAPFNGDIGVTLDEIVLTDPNLYETSVNGSVSLTGPLTGGARIAGTLNLGQTDVQVPSSGIGALGDLPDVVHVGPDGRVLTTLERAGVTGNGSETTDTGSGPAFPLDVTVNAPNRIFIRGRGLDAELGGSLNLGGTTANIIPVGQFDLIRGRLDILQQRFELDEGSASLQGDFIPVIRLVATTEASTGTVIQIIVSGPADQPEVTFESTPDLPQDEVLSQLIFGRNLSDISPLQAVQLAAAVGTLAGRGGGGIIDNFRQGIGLDDFDVTTDEEGNAAVRAGAYLSENVYTDVTINAEGETEINLNLDITSEITAKGTVDADGETSIGVFFERDY